MGVSKLNQIHSLFAHGMSKKMKKQMSSIMQPQFSDVQKTVANAYADASKTPSDTVQPTEQSAAAWQSGFDTPSAAKDELGAMLAGLQKA